MHTTLGLLSSAPSDAKSVTNSASRYVALTTASFTYGATSENGGNTTMSIR